MNAQTLRTGKRQSEPIKARRGFAALPHLQNEGRFVPDDGLLRAQSRPSYDGRSRSQKPSFDRAIGSACALTICRARIRSNLWRICVLPCL